MKYPGLLLLTLIFCLSGFTQNSSTATASVSATVIHPAIISLENNIIEGPVHKKTSGLQSAPFIWLGKRVASFFVEAGENYYSIAATTDNPAIEKLEIIEGKQGSKGKSFRIIPVFSGMPQLRNRSADRCLVSIHFN